MEKLYTIQEACELLTISRSTIFRMAKKGEIKFTYISEKVARVKESEIKKILGSVD